jgi:hypothetical protein
MKDLSLHILDIVENSIAADADEIKIALVENRRKDLLLLEINDNGTGMDEETRKKAVSPFFTSKTTRSVGLGLSLLAAAAKASGGEMSISSGSNGGTRIRARFSHSHVDRKPLGDIPLTLLTLISANPGVDFVFRHVKDGRTYRLDTKKIKARLGAVSLDSLEGRKSLRGRLDAMREKQFSGEKRAARASRPVPEKKASA